jgi:PhnB protein
VTKISPWLSVTDAAAAVRFYEAGLGAVEVEADRFEDGGTLVVAHLSIGEADFWLQADPSAGPDADRPDSVRMILSVADPDAVFARAVAAGAMEVAPVSDGHGWRIGRIAAPDGHHWEIGRPLESHGS